LLREDAFEELGSLREAGWVQLHYMVPLSGSSANCDRTSTDRSSIPLRPSTRAVGTNTRASCFADLLGTFDLDLDAVARVRVDDVFASARTLGGVLVPEANPTRVGLCRRVARGRLVR